MTIREFVDLFYIKAYLKNQDLAFKNLVKGSVERCDLLTYDDDSYHGILAGHNPHLFAQQVLKAELRVKKISNILKHFTSRGIMALTKPKSYIRTKHTRRHCSTKSRTNLMA